MEQDSLTYKALQLCLSRGIPFALTRYPRQRRLHFFAAPSLLTAEGRRKAGLAVRKSGGFFITRFAEPLEKAIHIPCELSAAQVLTNIISTDNADLPPCPFNSQSTDHLEYTNRITETTRRLRLRTDAKTVMSAVCVMPRPANMAEAIRRLFNNSPNDFCNCFYHPEVGYWAGATPEVLLEFRYADSVFKTMALAGTLPIGEDWDSKNLKENKIVSDYITSQLSIPEVRTIKQHRLSEKTYGNIKHLLVAFSGRAYSPDPMPLINALNPTPALNGFPKQDALADISELEPHQRICYGGLIGVKRANTLHAYVNIRCFQFTDSQICYFSGGGIMPDSDPETEWREAAAKRNALISRM